MNAHPIHAEVRVGDGPPYLYVTYRLDDGRILHRSTSATSVLLAMLAPSVEVRVVEDKRRPGREVIEFPSLDEPE